MLLSPEHWMQRAIELSQRGFPAPNPHVGCVIVSNGELVGEGWHEYAGAPHAEAMALAAAGDRARGAEVYVTLEPCSHFGRTPPCSDALIAAGVSKVYYAVPDPTPHGSGGVQKLCDAGIEVVGGLMSDEATKANWQFLTAWKLGRPVVVVKAAMSLDGRIALPSGESQWITGEAAREQAHRLRAECGAVLVGDGTVRFDNPHLTARIPGVHNQPTRTVLDPLATLSGKENVFNQDAPSWWFTSKQQPNIPIRHTCLPAEPAFDLKLILAELWSAGITGALVEGGAKTIASFVEAGLVDRYELFIAPKLLGSGPAWLQTETITSLAETPLLRFEQAQACGEDLWITAFPRETPPRGDSSAKNLA